MKCPRCGSEMNIDSHRKIPLQMCYNCGYIEGRAYDRVEAGETNFERMKSLDYNELTVFLAAGLGLDEDQVGDWLGKAAE